MWCGYRQKSRQANINNGSVANGCPAKVGRLLTGTPSGPLAAEPHPNLDLDTDQFDQLHSGSGEEMDEIKPLIPKAGNKLSNKNGVCINNKRRSNATGEQFVNV
ncbi:unnamed protein product, partial [Iphiclides podalirius]